MGEQIEAPTVGDVVARRVRALRKSQGDLKQQELADRTAALGYPMARATVAKIEAGGTRAQNVSLIDVLVLAAALDVAPLLLFIPLGDEDAVKLTDNLILDPQLAIDWLAGEEPLAALPDNRARNIEAWHRNTLPVRLFRQLRQLQRRARSEGTEEAKRALEQHFGFMRDAGLMVSYLEEEQDGER
ncbi:MAG: hypothetical protein U5K30_01430 [Acidimicrobiales bacterium]|nr:hypothetical protein [Acidimicrobiales bacterium]